LTLLGLIFSTTFLSKTNAQEYKPMAIEGAHWIVVTDLGSTLWWDEKYSFTIRGDTTVNGGNYKKVYREHFEFNNQKKTFTNRIIFSKLYALMRDDIIQKKVYAINFEDSYDNCPQNKEYLLFDFSVEKGDTLDWCNLDARRRGVDSICRVDSIGLIKTSFLEGSRKTIYTVFRASLYQDGTPVHSKRAIIEGLGHLSFGPFLITVNLIDYCVGKDADCGIISATKNPIGLSLKVFPNPTADVLILEQKSISNIKNDLSVDVLDMTGKVIKRQAIQSHQTVINVKDIAKGFYLLRVNKNSEFVYQTKFIKN
jgi:hypothetical protein